MATCWEEEAAIRSRAGERFEGRPETRLRRAAHLLAEAPVVLHDAVVHVAAVAQLQDEVELGGRVDDLVEPHHVGVLHHLHAAHLLEEVAPGHRVQLGLVYHLHGNLEREDTWG